MKFFVPMTIVGAAALCFVAAVADPPKRIATPSEMAKAAFAARRVCFLITLYLLRSGMVRAYGIRSGLREAARSSRLRSRAATNASAETQSAAATTPARP